MIDRKAQEPCIRCLVVRYAGVARIGLVEDARYAVGCFRYVTA